MSVERSLVAASEKHFMSWSFAEEHQLIQFVVQYNQGKEHWELRYDIITKYIEYLRESGHPVTRTANAMFERLKVLRRVIRDDIGSDKYGIDMNARYKLASRITREAVKRDKKGKIKRGPTRSEPRKRQRASSPYPGKVDRIQIVPASNVPSICTVSGASEVSNRNASNTQTLSLAAPLISADDDLDKSSITVGNDGDTSFDVRQAVLEGSASLDPPIREPIVTPRLLNSPAFVASVPEPSPHSSSQADEANDVSGPVVPLEHFSEPGGDAASQREDARRLPLGRVSAVVTLDDIPVVKKEPMGGPAQVRIGSTKRKDAAIIKELARMPNMTLNKAFVMYYDNIEVYQELYFELSEE